MVTEITEWQKLDEKLGSHRWLIRMLSEMCEYSNLNGLMDVSDAILIAKKSATEAIDAYEASIIDSMNTAFSNMMRQNVDKIKKK